MVLFSFTQLEKKMGLKENKEKKRFEREEEDWEDGFIPIHSIANKGK